MIKAVTISVILALAVYLSPQIMASHKTKPAPTTLSSTVTNSNLNTNTNTNTNTNENNIDIDIENNQTQTQNVTVAAGVPRVLPATGASSGALALMAGAIPLGLYMRKFKSSPKKILLKN